MSQEKNGRVGKSIIFTKLVASEVGLLLSFSLVAKNAYREVFKLPQVPQMLLITLFSRLPTTASSMTATVYVVTNLDRGYGAAALVGAMLMVGSAFGSPLFGRIVDGHGLRRPLAIWGLGCSLFWLSVPYLPYEALVALALPAGVLTLPIGSINRQVLTALVPKEKRKVAYSLDVTGLQLTFMAGPAVGIILVTQTSATIAFTCIASCFVLATAALFIMNPPVRAVDEVPVSRHARPTVGQWFDKRLLASLCVATGTLFCLVGNEVSVLATLRANDQTSVTGVVLSTMYLASAIGGMVYGARHHSVSQFKLMLLLTSLTVPVVFAAMNGTWWLLALTLIPANLVCAPTLAANTQNINDHALSSARGVTMGLLDSATRTGLATGAPVVGFVIDHTAPHWGFAAAGGIGLLLLSLALLLTFTTGTAKTASTEHPEPISTEPAGVRVAEPATAHNS